MDFKIPDRLTFKRKEVIKITRLEGKVIDYWEKEFGGINPVINKLGEKFYTKKDVEIILTIKQMLTVEKKEKEEIKKAIGASQAGEIEPDMGKPGKKERNNSDTLNIIRSSLQEILTILDKNVK